MNIACRRTFSTLLVATSAVLFSTIAPTGSAARGIFVPVPGIADLPTTPAVSDPNSNVDLLGSWSNTGLKNGRFKGRFTLIQAATGSIGATEVRFYLSPDGLVNTSATLIDLVPIRQKHFGAGRGAPRQAVDRARREKGKNIKPRTRGLTDLEGKILIAVIDPLNTVTEKVETNNVNPTPRLQ